MNNGWALGSVSMVLYILWMTSHWRAYIPWTTMQGRAILCLSHQFSFKKNHVKNTGQPDPKPKWPKPIFNPLKMTRFWPVTRLTQPKSNPTYPLCHVYFQWYVNYSYLIFHILFIYRCYNNYLCQKNFYDCNNWCGI